MEQQHRWADGPFDLLATPSQDSETTPHAAVHCAREMILSHNVLLRGLNSIYLQGPFLTSPQDISDFLFYCHAWVLMVQHHHSAEESVLFPELEKFTGDPDVMGENKAQHERFHVGLDRFEEFATTTAPEKWRWEDAKGILDAFVPSLVQHLREEIATLRGLERYDSEGLRSVWQKTEDAAKGDVRLPHMFDTILPMVLGCADKKFEGGVHKFPPFSFFFPYLADWWFGRKFRGAWRFCPCDMYGVPRQLAFGERDG